MLDKFPFHTGEQRRLFLRALIIFLVQLHIEIRIHAFDFLHHRIQLCQQGIILWGAHEVIRRGVELRQRFVAGRGSQTAHGHGIYAFHVQRGMCGLRRVKKLRCIGKIVLVGIACHAFRIHGTMHQTDAPAGKRGEILIENTVIIRAGIQYAIFHAAFQPRETVPPQTFRRTLGIDNQINGAVVQPLQRILPCAVHIFVLPAGILGNAVQVIHRIAAVQTVFPLLDKPLHVRIRHAHHPDILRKGRNGSSCAQEQNPQQQGKKTVEHVGLPQQSIKKAGTLTRLRPYYLPVYLQRTVNRFGSICNFFTL